MTLEFKSTYIRAIRERYFKASKKEKSKILDELCAVTGFHRKHAIRIISKGHKDNKISSKRSKSYSDKAQYHLKRLWHIMGRICSKKMVAAFPVWLNYYEHPDFAEKIKQELLSMSSSTIDRYLKSYKTQFRRTRRSGTKSTKRFKHVIPIKDLDSRAKGPGHLQADTVAHCGNSLSGQFIWTLTITDEYSGWTINRGMYTKSASDLVAAVMSALWTPPFKIKSFNSDNGTEFINQKLADYLKSKEIEFTRSRAYKKNDNAFVEQKNFTHVRELFGYRRFDKEELVFIMNEIYKDYFNLLHNFFIPQLKCIEVTRVGAKYKRKYDEPKTPFERLLKSSDLSSYQKQELIKKYQNLNPIKLRKELNDSIKWFNRVLTGKSDFKYKFSA